MRYFCPFHSRYFVTIFGDFEEFIDNQNLRRLSITLHKRQNDDFRKFNFFNKSRKKNIKYLKKQVRNNEIDKLMNLASSRKIKKIVAKLLGIYKALT